MPLLQIPADEAAEMMYEKLHGKTEGLPEKLQGVFWMSGNCLPDLMMAFDGSSFNPDKRIVTLHYGAPYNWTWSAWAPFPTHLLGWWMAVTAFGSYLTCSPIRFYFNEDYTDARLYLYVFNCIWLPVPMTWTMTDISQDKDGSVWDRGIYICCIRSFFSYKLCKIISGSGEHLSPFQDMLDTLWSTEQPGVYVNHLTIKARKQLMWGDRRSTQGGYEALEAVGTQPTRWFMLLLSLLPLIVVWAVPETAQWCNDDDVNTLYCLSSPKIASKFTLIMFTLCALHHVLILSRAKPEEKKWCEALLGLSAVACCVAVIAVNTTDFGGWFESTPLRFYQAGAVVATLISMLQWVLVSGGQHAQAPGVTNGAASTELLMV